MSKRGGHLWILLATPLLAGECRVYIHDLARRLGLPVKGSGLREGIEVFPRHDAIGEGEFGNAIRGPLGVHRGARRRFWFYGADYTLGAQMAYLNGLRKLAEEEPVPFLLHSVETKIKNKGVDWRAMTRAELLSPERELAANQKPELKLRHFPIVLAYVICIAAVLCAAVLLDALISIAAVTLIAGLLVVIVPVLFVAVLYQQYRKPLR